MCIFGPISPWTRPNSLFYSGSASLRSFFPPPLWTFRSDARPLSASTLSATFYSNRRVLLLRTGDTLVHPCQVTINSCLAESYIGTTLTCTTLMCPRSSEGSFYQNRAATNPTKPLLLIQKGSTPSGMGKHGVAFGRAQGLSSPGGECLSRPALRFCNADLAFCHVLMVLCKEVSPIINR